MGQGRRRLAAADLSLSKTRAIDYLSLLSCACVVNALRHSDHVHTIIVASGFS